MEDESEETEELDKFAGLEVSDDALDEHGDVLEDSSAGGGDDSSEREAGLEKKEDETRSASRLVVPPMGISQTHGVSDDLILVHPLEHGEDGLCRLLEDRDPGRRSLGERRVGRFWEALRDVSESHDGMVDVEDGEDIVGAGHGSLDVSRDLGEERVASGLRRESEKDR